MTQVITGRTGWDLISGVCFDAHYGDTDRGNLIKAYPEAEEAARTLSASADPRSEMWFLAEDRTGHAGLEEISKASACLLPRTGRIWRPGQPSMDLMAVYQESGRRLWPTLGTALGDLLG
jgi:hypothetical protein